MTKRIAAVIFIFVCSAIAWAILGSTLLSRTYTASDTLSEQVLSTWGVPQVQSPPSASYAATMTQVVQSEDKGKSLTHGEEHPTDICVSLESSDVNAEFGLDYRKKGLLWYSTYRVSFSGVYTFRNPTSTSQTFSFRFPLPAKKAIYDDMVMMANDQPLSLTTTGGVLRGSTNAPPGEPVVLHISYRSQGLDSWQYKLGEDVAEIKNFTLKITTDFGGFDFPENTLSPSNEKKAGRGWELTWAYRNLLSGFQIGMKMPEKLQPGPLAGRISFFAPVSLLFFFFVIFILTMLRGIEFHPMNYFFLACAFFAFHLLLAYLVDHISIHWAFVICSAVSLALVWSYLRLAVESRFALAAALAQFGYLILFSYAFFFEGFTGLTITIGAILTLFIAMQVTAKIRWADKFSKKPA